MHQMISSSKFSNIASINYIYKNVALIYIKTKTSAVLRALEISGQNISLYIPISVFGNDHSFWNVCHILLEKKYSFSKRR